MEYYDILLEDKLNLKIQKIDEKDYDYIYVLTDIHGSYNEFDYFYDYLQDKHGSKDKILIIIIGDSCDRGEGTEKLFLKYIEINKTRNIKLMHLLGNHEQMLLNSIYGKDYLNNWISNGGLETIFCFDKELEKKYNNDFINNISKIFQEVLSENYNFKEKFSEIYEYVSNFPHIIEGNENIFVHAGIDFNKKIENQDREEVLWRRDEWYLKNNTGKQVFYGHTPQKDVSVINNCYNLDTGICFGLKMSIFEIKNKKLIIIPKILTEKA